MLNKEIVFILGAGASVPYDFPDGKQLLKAIMKSLSDDHSLYTQVFGQDKGFAFRQHLELSGTSSIDEFLTNNPEHDDIGRFAIARMLMAKENPHYLMNPQKGGWYHYLYEALRAGICSIDLSKVSFITFNYDRSLEEYLWLRLVFDFGMAEYDAANILNGLDIVHIHGQLGRLPWQKENISGGVVCPYEPSQDVERIKWAAKCLRIQHEEHEQTTAAGDNAKTLIRKAQIIFFIGFGFSDDNMLKLGFQPGEACADPEHTLHGTCLGWTEQEKKRFNRRYQGISLVNETHGAIEFLRTSDLFSSIWD